jgi:hypothetical protein
MLDSDFRVPLHAEATAIAGGMGLRVRRPEVPAPLRKITASICCLGLSSSGAHAT